MLSPKYLPKNKTSFEDQLKLPQIPSRKNIQSVKKSAPQVPDLPNIKNKSSKQNNSFNKENNSLNLLQRKNTFEDQIKARLFEIQAAQKLVKNILGGPQATVHVGSDMTNFELKIEINRQILRKQRNKSHFTQKNPNLPERQKKQQNTKDPSLKHISSKENTSESIQFIPVGADMQIKIKQNRQFDNLQKKVEENLEPESLNRKKFNSERKPKNLSIPKDKQNTKVFKSIKQILENPQRIALENEAKKVKKMVKFTIEQLENKLRKMKNVDLSQSAVKESQGNDTDKKFKRKMTTAKSAGMIPIIDTPFCEEYTFKNWNRVEFGQQQQNTQQNQVNSNKLVRCHKSNFEDEVDQIQKLEMKSYKSIERMVENRKILIDLQLMNAKNKCCIANQKKGEKKNHELSV